jgi:hypothetical protein
MLSAKPRSSVRKIFAQTLGCLWTHDGSRGRLRHEMHLFLRACWLLFWREGLAWTSMYRAATRSGRLSVTRSHERRRMHPFLRTCWRYMRRPVRLRNPEVVGLALVDVPVSLRTGKPLAQAAKCICFCVRTGCA